MPEPIVTTGSRDGIGASAARRRPYAVFSGPESEEANRSPEERHLQMSARA